MKETFNTYFWDIIKNHYVDFKGKATRQQFWMFVLFYFVINAVLGQVCQWFLKGTSAAVLPALYGLALFLPYLAITCRRFRDAGVSLAWFFIILIIQILSGVVFAVFLILLLLHVIGGGAGSPDVTGMILGAVIAGGVILASSIAVFVICLLPSKRAPIDQPNQLDQLN